MVERISLFTRLKDDAEVLDSPEDFALMFLEVEEIMYIYDEIKNASSTNEMVLAEKYKILIGKIASFQSRRVLRPDFKLPKYYGFRADE